ncbi:MAG: DDE-type integrase/transposase/recombinase [Acidobacteria bacterium]|nr:DDE-type integrase/transposase/recombinase [Acidobacteriota bacterium]
MGPTPAEESFRIEIDSLRAQVRTTPGMGECPPALNKHQARIQNILAAQTEPGRPEIRDLSEFADREWMYAKRRYKAVQAVIDDPAPTPNIRKHAEKAGCHVATLYRWLHLYEESGGEFVSLITSKAIERMTRFSPRVEEIIRKAIDEKYMSAERPSLAATHAEAETNCLLEGFTCPGKATIRSRIQRIELKARVRARFGPKEARKLSLHGPGLMAEGPLSMVQIDHTKLDVMVLDEESRKAIGRPYLSVVLDVATRMVLGLLVTLDAPSVLTLGLALANAILPKDAWLAELEILAEWPCFGIPGTVACDNAYEFHSEALVRACEKYKMNLQWRPLGRPEFGGHIERFMRTISSAVHEIPGTTFSNTRDKGDYKPHEHACMTLRELESWLVQWVVGVYHIRPHGGLDGKSPLNAWKDWFLEMSPVTGREEPETIRNPLHLRIDFLPMVKRSIQQYGVKLFGVTYHHDVLRRHVRADNEKGKTEEFIFRYDPRDISIIYFWEPKTKLYFPIPWRDTSRKPCSIWEHREAGSAQREMNQARIPHQTIAENRKALSEKAKAARKTTLSERRVQTRKRHHEADNIHQLMPGLDRPKSQPAPALEAPPKPRVEATAIVWEALRPFDDME